MLGGLTVGKDRQPTPNSQPPRWLSHLGPTHSYREAKASRLEGVSPSATYTPRRAPNLQGQSATSTMKLRRIFDWGMHNWCLTPALMFGRGSNGGWWCYVFFLRGRIGCFYS
jgi:hypothetical protein